MTKFNAWRKRLGLTLPKAAKALGLSQSCVEQYDAGRVKGSRKPSITPHHVTLAMRWIEDHPDQIDGPEAE